MSKSLNGVENGFTKIVSALTSVATVLSLAGFAAVAPMAAHAAVPSDYGLKEGQMISAAGSNDPDVYIVNDWGYKRLFLNPVIFNMYGQLTGGFAAVKNVSAATRDAFPTSGLFTDCQAGSPNNNGNVYAVEVTGEDTGTLHHVALTGDQAVAQDANFFKKVFCINDNEFNWYPKGSDYTSLSQVPVYTRGSTTGTPTPTTSAGSIMASLSPDNPASGTVLATQGVADLAHFRLTNTGSTAVAVNSLTFQRLGVSGDTTYTNAYVYGLNPYARLTDAVTPSSGTFSITGGSATSTIITVPANGFVDIAFKSDIGSSTSGQTVGVALTSINGSAVAGLNGNLMTVAANPSDMASAQFVTGSILPAAGTTDPLNDTVVWSDPVTVTNKNVYLKSFALRQTDSILNSDVQNFRLYVDGTQVGQVQNLDANGMVTFNMASPVTLLTGTRTLKVLADVIGGTNRKLQMSLRSAGDVQMTDSNYGETISPTLDSGSFPLNGGELTINAGSVVIQKDTSSPSGNVVKGTSDAVLGRWTVTAYGEPEKISSLIVGLESSNSSIGSLRNGRLMVYPVGNSTAATQYGSTTTLTKSMTASTSYTTNLVVNPGSPVIVEARADIYDNDGTDSTAAGDTITADLYTGSSNAQGMSSLTTSNAPSATVDANQLTIQSGSITISKYANFADQNVVVPQSNVKIGDFVIAGSTNEAVNVNTLTLDVTVGGSAAIGDLTNVYLKWNGVSTQVKSTVSATGNTYSVNQVLPVNGNVHVEVFADLGNRSSGTYQSKLEVSGTTAQSAQTVNTTSSGTSTSSSGSTFAGQTMTIGSSTFTSAVGASTPVAQLVAGQQTYDVAQFNFTSTTGASNISEVQFKTLASSSENGIASVILKGPSGNTLATGALSTSGSSQIVTFGSLSGLTVPADDPNGINLTVAVTTGKVGVNAASTGLNVGLTLDYVKYTDPTGVLQTSNTDRVGNNMYLHAAYPVVTSVALPSTLLATGTQTLSQFTLAAAGASNAVIGWNQIILTVSKTSNPNLASASSMKFYEDGTDITSQVTITNSHVGAGQTSGTITITGNSPSERQVGVAGHTYKLTTTNLGGSLTTGDYVTVAFNQPSSQAQPDTATVVKGTSASLTWSDRSASSHSTTTTDWMNDYLVKNLPLSQSMTR